MSAELESLIWVDATELPAEARALFDRSVPLPEGTVLFATGPNALAFGLSVAALVFAAGVALAFLSAVPGAFANSPTEGAGTSFVAALCCLGVGFVVRRVREAGDARAAHRRGELRQGLFLTPDRAVFTSADGCFQVPRAKITDARVYTAPGAGSRVSSPELLVVGDGAEPFPVRATGLYVDPVREIAARTADWARD